MCIEFSEVQQKKAEKLTSQKPSSKLWIISHLEGTSVASRNGLVGGNIHWKTEFESMSQAVSQRVTKTKTKEIRFSSHGY